MHIAIVEDDLFTQAQLERYVLQHFADRRQTVRVSVFSDGDEILQAYAASYDAIFLDIQMSRLNGMRTAELIRQLDEDVLLVFITNLAHYAVQGYAVRALDFVLKPVNELMLRQLLLRIEKLLSERTKKYIALPTEKGLTRMDAAQILFVETENHSLRIHTEKGEFRLRDSMKNMEKLLEPCHFFRCNSCYLVNLRHVESVEGSFARLTTGQALSVSRPRYKAFMEALTRYIGGGSV